MSGPRVAITRAAPENERTAARVRALGAEPVLAPLLEIHTLDFDANLIGVQALLFTSANGVRAFAGASAVRDKAVLAVGDATAQTARDLGFSDVRSADGDVGALTTMAESTLDSAAGAVVHFSGAEIAGDLVRALDAAGFEAERRIAYEARAATAIPAGLGGPLDVVLFHSPRAARIFVRLGAPGAGALTAGCFSAAVADAARGAPWKRIIVSPAPREEAFLEATLNG